MHLFTSFCKSNSESRNVEYIECLKRNNDNRYIKSITVFSEDKDIEQLIEFNKINFVRIDSRPTFRFIIDYINNNIDKNEIVLISNSDIYFDESLQFVKFDKDYAYCLTRTNELIVDGIITHKHENVNHGSDVWILKTPIITDNADFYMGIAGCDPIMAYNFLESGYTPINPSFLIKCYHLHNSKIRTWTIYTQLLGTYLAIYPSNEITFKNDSIYSFIANRINHNIIFSEYNYSIASIYPHVKDHDIF
jgi:hypothetical protein